MKALLSLLLVLGAATAPASASATTVRPPEPAAAPVAAVSTPAPPADEKLQCQKERVLGSNRSKRVCTTAAQRDAAREAARAQMDAAQRDR